MTKKITIFALLPAIMIFSMVSNAQGLGNSTQAINDVKTGYNDAVVLAKDFNTCFPATAAQSDFCAGFTAGWNASNLCQLSPQFPTLSNYCLGYRAGFNATISSGEK